MNPPNTMVTDSFLFTAYDPSGNVIARSVADERWAFEPTAGTIYSTTLVRESNTVGETTAAVVQFKI